MAIFHLHIKHIGKSGGNSAVAASAYRSGSKIAEISEDGSVLKSYNFRNKKGVAFSKVFVPENASLWMKDRESLWNSIQNKFDKRVNSVFAQEIDVALPVEFSLEENKELLSDFVSEVLVSEGMIADVNIHMDNPKNPHAHLMLSTREIIQDEKGDITFGKKVRYWDKREFLVHVRKSWADFVNHYFINKNMEVRISHLSNKERGIELKPSIKEGVGRILENSDRSRINAEIRRENQSRIEKNPEIIIESLSYLKSVFTRKDIEKEISRYFEGGCVRTLKVVLRHERLGIYKERDLDGRILYKDKVRSRLEKNFVSELKEVREEENNYHNLSIADSDISAKNLFEKIAARAGFESEYVDLSEDQRNAILGIVNSGTISILEGFPGSGKTTVMREVSKIFKRHNRKIIASSVSSAATNILGEVIGVKALNTTKLRYEIEKSSNFQLDLSMDFLQPNERQKIIDSNTILIIDEASMVDLAEMHYFVSLVRREGAKLILIGDRNQLSAVRIKGALVKIARYFKPVTLSEVRRHEDSLHREATNDIFRKEIKEALQIYQKRGNLVFKDNLSSSLAQLSRDYVSAYIENPDMKIQALAYRRNDVANLNRMIRDNLKISGHIRDEEFAVGDRVIFTKNDKSLGVLNNDIGTITGKALGILRVRLDRKNTLGIIKLPISISVVAKSCKDLDYAYASTIHKAQGSTYDKVFGLFNKNINYNSFNVLATRHRKDLQIYIPQNEFSYSENEDNLQAIEEILFKEENNAFEEDYEIDNREILEEYLESRYLLHKLISKDSKSKRELRVAFNRRKYLANKICNNLEQYRQDLNISGISYRDLIRDSGKVFGNASRPATKEFISNNDMKLLIFDLESLSKIPDGPIFLKDREVIAGNIFQKIDSISKQIYSQEASLASLREELLSKEDYNMQMDENISNIIHFQKILFPAFLRNIFARDPTEVIAIWDDIYKEKSNLDLAATSLMQNAGDLKSKRFGSYLSLLRIKEDRNLSLLKDRLVLYEKNKKTIQEYEKHQSHQIDLHPLRAEIRKLKSKMPNYNFKNFIENISDIKRYSKECELSDKLYKHIRDSHVKKEIEKYKHQISRNACKSNEIKYRKEFNQSDIEGIFRKYANKINPDGKIKISNSQISCGSLSMNLQNGLWQRFSTSESGNIYNFLELAGTRPVDHLVSNPQKTAQKESPRKDWEPYKIVPKYAPKFNPKKDISYLMQGSNLDSIYEYKDKEGKLIGYCVRISNNESKSVLPISYCKLGAKNSWRVKGFLSEDSSKPIYGLEKLSSSDSPILIVEGEKTADAASKIFKGHIVISWLGGAKAASRVNWTCLKDREVYIWPDNDRAGIECGKLIMHKVGNISGSYRNIFMIDTTKLGLPVKWDLADPIPETLKNFSPLDVLKNEKLEPITIPNFITEKERRIYWQQRISGEVLTSSQVADIAMREEEYYRILDSDSCKDYSSYLSKRGDIEKSHEFLSLKQELYKEILVSVALKENIKYEYNSNSFLDLASEKYQEKISNFTDHLQYVSRYKSLCKEKSELYSVILRDILFLQKTQNHMILEKDQDLVARKLERLIDAEKDYSHREDKLKLANKAYVMFCSSNYYKEIHHNHMDRNNIQIESERDIQQRITVKSLER